MPQIFFIGGKETWLQSQADQVANVEQIKQGEELIVFDNTNKIVLVVVLGSLSKKF